MDNNTQTKPTNLAGLTTFLAAFDMITEQGGTKVKMSMPKIDEKTKKRYKTFGVWYYNASGEPRVLLLPTIDWDSLNEETQQAITIKVKEMQ